jgi:hypothetical protein
MATRKDIYKQVSLYNPETRKTKNILIKKSDFNTEDELNAYCKKLRDDNKVKNAEWRRQQRVTRYNDTLAVNAIPDPVVLPIDIVPPPKNQSSRVALDLDGRTGNTIVIYGSSKRGKSTLMMHLYKKYFRSKDRINTLFSGNPQLRVYRKDKRLLVGYGFNDASARYIQMQQYVNVNTNHEYTFTNLFDDIIDQKHAPIVNKLILTYRNSKISSIICLQYVYLLSKQNRANINHTFIFGMNSVEDCRGIIELILRPYFTEMGFKTIEDQIKYFKHVTDDHGFFYLDNVKSKLSTHRLKLGN